MKSNGWARSSNWRLVRAGSGIEAAKASIIALAGVLGLEGSERRSYLELLKASEAK